MPAPETPNKINSGGNQQQLEAMMADSTVPALAISSPRPERDRATSCWFVAPGDWLRFVAQQSGAGAPSFVNSSAISFFSWRSAARLFHFRIKPLFLHRSQQLLQRYSIGLIGHKQQV
jgi:hypothetical protein